MTFELGTVLKTWQMAKILAEGFGMKYALVIHLSKDMAQHGHFVLTEEGAEANPEDLVK